MHERMTEACQKETHPEDGEPKAKARTPTEKARREKRIDETVEEQFPASDPPAQSPTKPDKVSHIIPPGQPMPRRAGFRPLRTR